MILLIVNENSEGKSRDQSVKILKCATLLGRHVSRINFEMLHKEKKPLDMQIGSQNVGCFQVIKCLENNLQ